MLETLCYKPTRSEDGHLAHAHTYTCAALLLDWNGSVDFKNHDTLVDAMDSTTILILLGLVIIIGLLIANLLMLNSRASPPTAIEIGQALSFPTTPEIAQALNIPTTESITMALGASLNQQEISQKIGAFTELSRNMEDTTKKFHQMTISKSKRAGWGEWYLDQELKEAFPGVKIRQEVKELGNLKPDAAHAAHLAGP